MRVNISLLNKYLNKKEMREYLLDLLNALLAERYGQARSMLINMLNSLEQKEIEKPNETESRS